MRPRTSARAIVPDSVPDSDRGTLRWMPGRRWVFLLGLCITGCGLVLDLGGEGAGDGESGAPPDVTPADAAAPADGAVVVDGNIAPVLSPRIGAASRIPRMGGAGDYFLFGANLPWRSFGRDFGGPDGARTAAAQTEVGEAMARASAAGFRAIRWVALSIPLDDFFDAEAARDDIRAAVDLAAEHGLYLELVLVLHTALPTDAWDSAEARAATLTWVHDLAATAELHDAGRLFTWTLQAHYAELDGAVSTESFADTLQDFVHAIRAAAPSAWVTGYVESFAAGANVCSLGADIIGIAEQGHGTPSSCGICSSYDEITTAHPDLRCPVVISVFYADGAGSTDPYQPYLDSGYAGAVPHSLLPERTMDRVPIDDALAREFASRHEGVLGP